MVNKDYVPVSKSSEVSESVLKGFGPSENGVIDRTRNKSLPLGYAFTWLTKDNAAPELPATDKTDKTENTVQDKDENEDG